ncbi:hypothetical protein I7I48_09951 [Histoplasma ohiense]|nr:hypothetical protein I7I48_09951 [Histoplasma ohiense (nom. inval.)]
MSTMEGRSRCIGPDQGCFCKCWALSFVQKQDDHTAEKYRLPIHNSSVCLSVCLSALDLNLGWHE